MVSTIFVALFRKFGTIWHLNTAAGEVAYCYSKSEVKLSQSACNDSSMDNKCVMQSCTLIPRLQNATSSHGIPDYCRI